MSEETITLRGHHLSLFADYYFNNRGRSAKSLKTNDGKRSEERVDIYSSYITRTYSPQMRKRMDDLWQRLIDVPETKVKIVDGLDSLCDSCPNYEPEKCDTLENDEEDKATVDEYEFQSSAHYSARKLLIRFEEYKRSTGFRSPRERFLELMRLYPPEPQDDDLSDNEIERLMNSGGK